MQITELTKQCFKKKENVGHKGEKLAIHKSYVAL